MSHADVRPASDGTDSRDALRRAIGLHRAGDLAKAEPIYRRILSRQPDDPDALHYFGVLLHERGRSREAVDLIRRAIDIAPEYFDAHNNLGNVLQASGQLAEAVGAYRRALALRPRHAPTHANLGIALRALGTVDEAVASLRRAIEIEPRLVDAHVSLGYALGETGDLDRAIEAFYQAIALDPKHIRAYQSLARALYRAGRTAEAARAFERWLAVDPRNPVALHMRAACSGERPPPRASDEYVEQVFDAFAEHFDENVRRLDYHAPDLVMDALAAAVGAPGQAFDVLDAGCGTGLCGPRLRPYARRLVGVDLSRGMLDRAAGSSVYDDLITAELTRYLGTQRGAYDLVISIDTLVYFGDLRPVFVACGAALRPGGRLIFTVESADVDERTSAVGYRLNPSGRYSHHEMYLRAELAAAGFTGTVLAAATLRLEGGSPVIGYVVTASKG